MENAFIVRWPIVSSLTLHRGIAVPASRVNEVRSAIEARGLSGKDGTWQIPIPDVPLVRAKIDQLFAYENLRREDFLTGELLAVCSCGTANDACYYAFRHNRSLTNDTAVVIEFTAPMEHVTVDPKDFLCTAFQLW